MKLNELVTTKAVGTPRIPKRMLKTIRRKDEVNVFLDFIKEFDKERKKKK